ncbi:helix-turn-helix transcriptional regulator [Isoptericola chiayiensis]|uniref:Helix-turn-helix transcriptional regulator n=1 Tax=Isoptericola chiayiensis TaxID=579446 RepID=A0ABP8YGE3_9MICO|nr:helix-turn-helix domain-containing protein [Isoptericola chiayiensis]NOW00099.1 transcriptional regulator with XRE-family HTH domain [Isoptericola chiayiensis]
MNSASRVVPTLAEYLRARRVTVRIEDTALLHGRPRRVQGLRREEVAELACISPEYYQRLEQGRDRHPTDQVLVALSRALGVGEVGLTYMRRLASAIVEPAVDAPSTVWLLRPLLDTWSDSPAYVTDANLDILAANALAGELSDGVFVPGRNVALEFYLDPLRRSQPRWDALATMLAGWLRMTARDDEPRSVEVRETLLTDAHFRDVWERHDVSQMTGASALHRVGTLGPLPFEFTVLEISGAPGHLLFTYQAAAGSPSAAALRWARARTASGTSTTPWVSSRGPGAASSVSLAS